METPSEPKLHRGRLSVVPGFARGLMRSRFQLFKPYVNKIFTFVPISINDFDKRDTLSPGRFIDILYEVTFVRYNLQNSIN